MALPKKDILGGVGAVSSAIAIFLAFIWDIGLFQLMFSFIAGSFSTYFIQSKLQDRAEKREAKKAHELVMRDKIYGPAYEKLNAISERIEDFQDLCDEECSLIKGIESLENNYLFLLSNKEIKKTISEIKKKMYAYKKCLSVANQVVNRLSEDPVRIIFPAVRRVNPNLVTFSLCDAGAAVERISLREAILKKISFCERFADEQKKCQSPTISVKIQTENREAGHIRKGYSITQDKAELDRIKEACSSITNMVWADRRLIDLAKERKQLTKYLEFIIPKLRNKIKNEEDQKKLVNERLMSNVINAGVSARDLICRVHLGL